MRRGSRNKTTQGFKDSGEEKEFLASENVFSNMEKSYILEINKGGGIVSMTPYTQTQIQGTRLEWL